MLMQSLKRVLLGGGGGGGGPVAELIVGANRVIGLFEKVSHMAQKHRAGIRQIKSLRYLNMVPCPSAFVAF